MAHGGRVRGIASAAAVLAVAVGLTAIDPAGVTEVADAAPVAPLGVSHCNVSTSPVMGTLSVPMANFYLREHLTVTVDACIDGKGPFKLTVDTGATTSSVSPQLARALHLPTSGTARIAVGISCTAVVHPVKIARWSIGSVPLQAQSVLVTPYPGITTSTSRGHPVGFLGSDVLSRFGAVKLDYQHHQLDLPGSEGAPFSQVDTVAATPPSLLAAEPESPVTVPLVVTALSGNVRITALVRFGDKGPIPFAVDTGAAVSAISSAKASQLHLDVLNSTMPLLSLNCESRVPLAASGRWSVGSAPLHEQNLAVVRLPGAQFEDKWGSLGTDQLSRFGQVVIDFAGSRLLLY